MSVSTTPTTTTAGPAEEGPSPPEHSTRMTAKDNNDAERDEQVEGTSLAVTLNPSNAEYSDPAILDAKPAQPLFRYARDELVQLRQVPLSQKRPEYLNIAYNNSNGIWDPELWHRSRSETPSENGVRPEQLDTHKRRSGDPRERLRKEQDGIVLSPQRRSFNSGCFVPLKENQRSNRPHSPLGSKGDASHMGGHRELPPGARRIGSGRILTRDVPWDYQDKDREADNDFGYRRERKDVDRDRDRDERFERRSFGRDFGDMGKDKGGRGNNRYDRRRIDRDEEPEWFSGGPLSQNETIELRGFDDADCERAGNKRKHSAAQKKKQKERTITKGPLTATDNGQQPEAKERQPHDNENASRAAAGKSSGGGQEQAPAPPDNNNGSGAGGDGDRSKSDNNETAESSEQSSFNLDDILKCDTIAGLLSNGVGGEEGDTAAGSRFSRWFKRESPVKETLADNSRRSSLQDEHIIRNLLNDISEPNVTIPGDSELYFAPISPAGNTGNVRQAATGMPAIQKPFNIIEMLQRSKQHSEGHGMKNIDVSGKVLSLEELESRMMQQGGGDPGAMRAGLTGQGKHQMSQKPENEMMAFKKLLAQASGAHTMTANNGPHSGKTQPMSLLEMLSHTQQQDEAARLATQMMGPSSPNPISAGHLTNDIAFKLQQVQNQLHAQQQQHQAQLDMLSKLMNVNLHRQQMGASPLPDMRLNQNRELLSRPEAQAILQGLERGDITPQHLYQQLAANPAMQPRHRELLVTILKLHGGGGGGTGGVGPSPRVLSPVPPHPMFQQQQQQQSQQQQSQQQLRVSPLPNAFCVSPILATSPNTLTVPAMHQRIPSPRELQVHTQNIMQRALIKKKLEEQQENYKKRQEMQQRGQSPGRGLSPAKHTASPTPLAFTPTSVLRKMTAEKDEGSKDGSKVAADMHGKLPQSRAITGIKPPALQPQPQHPQPWNLLQQLKQPAGRAIVKNANLQQQQQQSQQQPQDQQQQQQFYQQQQRLYGQQQPQQPRKIGPQYAPAPPTAPQGAPSHQPPQLHHFSSHQQHPFSSNPQQQFQQQQLTQHQLRAQHQQHQPPQPQYNSRPGQQQAQPQQQPLWSQQQHHQLLAGHSFGGLGERGGAGNSGGDLSPTSNQLARWFSPELLERARAGKVPNMPSTNTSQHAVSLEEIERQTAPPVHN